MPTTPNQFSGLAAKHAKLAGLVQLFEQLAGRAETLARMEDDFLAGVIQHREVRTGKPVRYSKRQQASLAEFDRDAAQAAQEMAELVVHMDDPTLIMAALSNGRFELKSAEGMLSAWPAEDLEMALRMIEFRRETIRMIEEFAATSPYKEKVK